MKTVKILIEVEVSDITKWVTVDEDGTITAHYGAKDPHVCSPVLGHEWVGDKAPETDVVIVNWRDCKVYCGDRDPGSADTTPPARGLRIAELSRPVPGPVHNVKKCVGIKERPVDCPFRTWIGPGRFCKFEEIPDSEHAACREAQNREAMADATGNDSWAEVTDLQEQKDNQRRDILIEKLRRDGFLESKEQEDG